MVDAADQNGGSCLPRCTSVTHTGTLHPYVCRAPHTLCTCVGAAKRPHPQLPRCRPCMWAAGQEENCWWRPRLGKRGTLPLKTGNPTAPAGNGGSLLLSFCATVGQNIKMWVVQTAGKQLHNNQASPISPSTPRSCPPCTQGRLHAASCLLAGVTTFDDLMSLLMSHSRISHGC